MKKTLAVGILFFVLFSKFILSIDIDYRKELIVEHLDNKKSYLIIAFFDYNSCIKCYINPKQIIDELLNIKDHEFSVLALVNCNRAKEIRHFKEDFNWSYSVKPDIKNIAREKLGCSKNIDLCILNKAGDLIVEIDSSEPFKSNIKKIKNSIK